MITTNSISNQWQIIGGCLVLASGAIQAVPNAPFQVTIHYHQTTQRQPETYSVSDYIARIRQNPRRKAAMDKATQKIATQLAEQGETIISLRLAKGYTQSELAQAAGLQQSYLSRIENQPCTISEQNISKIAHALNCSPDAVRIAFKRHWTQLENQS